MQISTYVGILVHAGKFFLYNPVLGEYPKNGITGVRDSDLSSATMDAVAQHQITSEQLYELQHVAIMPLCWSVKRFLQYQGRNPTELVESRKVIFDI